MTISDMYATIRQLATEGQSGWLPPNEVARALNLGSTDKYNEERRLYEQTGHISDNLRMFKKESALAVTGGILDIPDDYGYRTNLAVTSTGKKIDIVPDSEWVARINDPVDPPTVKRAIGSIRGQTIKILPTSITQATLHYLCLPATMEIDFDTDANGDITINQGASTDCDWPEECHDDIMLRGLSYLGVQINQDLLVKLKSFKKQTEGV